MIDLHTHTTASDGSLTPTELVRQAAALGITYLAVADHDTVDGVAEAAESAKAHGIGFIPAIEMSTVFNNKSVDMLGYGIDIEHPRLREALKTVIEHRHRRIDLMVERLQSHGLPVSVEAVHALRGGGTPGRPHVAMALVEAGVAHSVKEAFQRFIGRGHPGFVPKNNMPIADAIRLIREAGGIAVLAHPLYLQLDNEGLADFIDQLIPLGLGGIEAYYGQHTRAQVAAYEAMAAERGLVMTGGSDFHGDSKPDIAIGMGPEGQSLPEHIAENLIEAIDRL